MRIQRDWHMPLGPAYAAYPHGDGSTENFVESEFSISSVRWLRLDADTVKG
jgi:hypothetical protein